MSTQYLSPSGEIIESVIEVDGQQLTLEDRFHPDFVTSLVPYDPSNPPAAPETPANLVPAVVTMRQARLALLAAGLLDDVNQAVAQAPQEAQIDWEFAATVERSSSTVEMLATALNLDEATLDALFTDAATR